MRCLTKRWVKSGCVGFVSGGEGCSDERCGGVWWCMRGVEGLLVVVRGVVVYEGCGGFVSGDEGCGGFVSGDEGCSGV